MKTTDVRQNFWNNSYHPVSINRPAVTLAPETKLFSIGSCFSDVIHNWLTGHFMQSKQSPFGNLYSPLSIFNSIDMMLDPRLFITEDIFHYDGLYRHFAFHTTRAKPDKTEFTTCCIASLEDNREYIKNADIMCVTFGNAWGFIHTSSGVLAANCHKLPPGNFQRNLQTVESITARGIKTINALKALNPTLKFIFSLSPVRYKAYTAQENALSKAILLLSIHSILEKMPKAGGWYFASYEIANDELRDYRYYKQDKVHLTQEAEEYICRRFTEAAGSNKLHEYMTKAGLLQKRLLHKPLHTETEQNKQFTDETKRLRKDLAEEFPHVVDAFK